MATFLSAEFKKGLGREAGADAAADEEDAVVVGMLAGGGVGDAAGPPKSRLPRNLGKLLGRQGLMLTKSAAR